MTDAVAWSGMGAMGAPMSRQLEAAGYQVRAVSLRPGRDPRAVAEALKDVVAVFTCLPGPPEVRDAWTGPGGLLESAPAGAVLVDVSTTGPALAEELAATAAQRGFAALDCPVSGGPQGAAAGTLAVMAGGDEAAIERVRPMLDAFGTVHVCGGPGAGQTVKLINQAAITGINGALGMAYALTVRSGISPDLVHGVLAGGAARGFLTDMLWPRMAADELEGGFAVQHMIKDIRLCRELAGELKLPTGLLDVVEDWYRKAQAECGDSLATQAIGKGVLA
ncbi:NAD(P)-dependent oxidoreductase [Amycolatopsis jejuensis]|uniref:NAD(P)-dependent oxidoreductase n=1 Tax=Amycolatopsis jejuensis TaxID=330084 RepID=UPI000525D614|nr:NAD(P)-dependent oxidoreductase [Amycolatopsis jejuensis]